MLCGECAVRGLGTHQFSFTHSSRINALPTVHWPSNAKDNQYPAFGWQHHVMQRMFVHYAMSDLWFHEQIDLAR